MSDDDECPCGKPTVMESCCGPIMAGDVAPATAEALMRSRYTAFVVGDVAHLMRSWHPSTRPTSLVLDKRIVWRGLQIEKCEAGQQFDATGVVVFTAWFEGGSQRERSRFARVGGDWMYVDGETGA
ncbi:MAG: YchJ family metal-binding protein [Acidimicrobiales bacterium]